MDRLSAYAAREAEADSPVDRQLAESEATAKLLEKLKIASEAQPADDSSPETKQNGESADPSNTESAEDEPAAGATTETDSPAEANGDVKKSRGIPDNVRLFEVFHEQVIHLVSMQRLPIQDITALLVSLINLAL